MDTLGGFLKLLRSRAGLSQTRVSAAAKLSETYYGKLELGRDRRPSPDVLLRILDALEATESERRYAIRLFAALIVPAPLWRYLDGVAPETLPPPSVVVPPPASSPLAIRRRAHRRSWHRRIRVLTLVGTIAGASWFGMPQAEGNLRLITNRLEVFCRIRRAAA